MMEMRELVIRIQEESIPDRTASKDPKAGVYLSCLRNRKQVRGAGIQ